METKQKEKKKKKKRKNPRLLLINYESLTREELISTIEEIEGRLRKEFKFHIGEENAISPVGIFEKCLDIPMESLNIYLKSFWWRVIQGVMRNLRHSGDLFIVRRGHHYFVLKTHGEAGYYKRQLRKNIEACERSMKKADEWVEKQKWKDF
jgi:hypothetical protein